MPLIKCSKRYDNLPFAHRQHTHEGHCRLIHGHNWSFEFHFGATELDSNGFVIDFGSLGWLKEWLTQQFDHTLVLSRQDPKLEFFVETVGGMGLAQVVAVPSASAEGIAKYLHQEVDPMVGRHTHGRVFLFSVVVHEDERNSATYG